MNPWERDKVIAVLKGARAGSGEFVVALQEADNRMLVEAVKECILRPSGVLVNRTRVEMLLETLLTRVTLLPPLELAAQKAAMPKPVATAKGKGKR